MSIAIIDKPNLKSSSYTMNTPLGTAQGTLLPVSFELESTDTDTYCLKMINPNHDNRSMHVEYTVTTTESVATVFNSEKKITTAVVSGGDTVAAQVKCQGFLSSEVVTYSVPVAEDDDDDDNGEGDGGDDNGDDNGGGGDNGDDNNTPDTPGDATPEEPDVPEEVTEP